ncbi:MAG: MinD/ParA family protein [Candidatus Eisenbacteria sp.]|nr:MinD/ParA family protein [Candidatus Eisenbacteria bacterium]
MNFHAPQTVGPLSVAFLSGKGGVGKSNLVANLAILMAEMGQRTLVLDGDLGLANVDLLLGLVPQQTLLDVVEGRCRLEEILLRGPAGIEILPASSGVEKMADLDDYRREVLLRSLEAVARDRDVLLIDTGSGIHRQSLRLGQAADEIVVVTTPEPPAFADAYAMLKVLSGRPINRFPGLVVNMARTTDEALRITRRLQRVARRFLGQAPELYGVILADETVGRAVRERQALVRGYPTARAVAGMRALAQRLMGLSAGVGDEAGGEPASLSAAAMR